MQISLDQFLSAIMARVDNLEATIDDLRLRTNIAMRLVKIMTPDFTRDDVKKAVEDELGAAVQPFLKRFLPPHFLNDGHELLVDFRVSYDSSVNIVFLVPQL